MTISDHFSLQTGESLEIRVYTHILPAEAQKIRQTVFVTEQGFQEEFDQTDRISIHLVAFYQTTAVATARIFPSPSSVQDDSSFSKPQSEQEHKWHIGRVAVLKEWRRKGVGRIIMLAAEREIILQGGTTAVLSAQKRALDFYQALGYQTTGDFYSDESYPHIQMTKPLKCDRL